MKAVFLAQICSCANVSCNPHVASCHAAVRCMSAQGAARSKHPATSTAGQAWGHLKAAARLAVASCTAARTPAGSVARAEKNLGAEKNRLKNAGVEKPRFQFTTTKCTKPADAHRLSAPTLACNGSNPPHLAAMSVRPPNACGWRCASWPTAW